MSLSKNELPVQDLAELCLVLHLVTKAVQRHFIDAEIKDPSPAFLKKLERTKDGLWNIVLDLDVSPQTLMKGD